MILIIQGFRTIVFIFIVVWISETKLDDFYHSGFSDYCLHLYCCLNFWDKAWWFLSFRVFGLLSSSLLLSEFLRQSLMIFIIQGFGTIVFIFIVVWISETKLDDFYHLGFWNYCLHLYCCLNFWDKAWWFLSFRVWNYCLHLYCCLNFWDKAWWFLSFRVLELLSSSLLLSEFLRQSLMIFIIQGFGTIVFIFIVVWISETKLEDFYHSGFSDYCLHLYCYNNKNEDNSPKTLNDK